MLPVDTVLRQADVESRVLRDAVSDAGAHPSQALDPQPPAVAAQAVTAATQEPILPIKPARICNPAMVGPGKKLYFDPRLSKSGFVSCSSCRNLSMGGTDNIKTSIGHNWQEGPINAPTVLDSSLNVAQFRDGRAADPKAQAGDPIANPGEKGFTHTLAVDVLQSIPGYVADFR